MSGHAWNEYRGGTGLRSRPGAVAACMFVALLGGTAGAMSSVTVLPASPDTKPVPAVWLEHDVRFTYVGQTTYYSCDGLRSKLRYIFDQLALRPGVKISV